MNQTEHLSTESLQGFAEGALAASERASLAAHVAGCSRCAAELAEWRTLFATLAALPQLVPAPDFANRVLAQVTIPARAPVWVQWQAAGRQLAQRLAPRSTRAWALASAFMILPLLVGGGVTAWLISKDYITAQSLWVFITDRTASSMQTLGASALTALLESSFAAWLVQQGRALAEAAGLRGLGVLAASVGGLIVLSMWVLYRNLFRTPSREPNHVPFTV
jgi:hypothetical protein